MLFMLTFGRPNIFLMTCKIFMLVVYVCGSLNRVTCDFLFYLLLLCNADQGLSAISKEGGINTWALFLFYFFKVPNHFTLDFRKNEHRKNHNNKQTLFKAKRFLTAQVNEGPFNIDFRWNSDPLIQPTHCASPSCRWSMSASDGDPQNTHQGLKRCRRVTDSR